MHFSIWFFTFVNFTGLNNYNPFSTTPQTLDLTLEKGVYDGCGKNKFCVGFPNHCVEKKSCKEFVATYKKDGKYIFEMQSSSQSAYVASALSFDRHMGDDSVIECVRSADKVEAFSSYTTRESGEFDSVRHGIPQNIIKLTEGRIKNGAIYCKVERDEDTTVRHKKFDLKHGKFYLLLASGSRVKKDKISVHNLGHTSSQKIIHYK